MSISFSGLGSGMDYASWVTQLVEAKTESVITPLQTQYSTLSTKQSTLTTVKSSYSTLLSATQTFTDAKYGTGSDLFSSNTVTSSDSKQISATVTNSTPRQSLSVYVSQLATCTKVTSQNSVGSPIDMNTKVSSLASGSVKEGKMSFYVNDVRYSIDVSASDTLQDIADKIQGSAKSNGESLVDVSVTENGEFMIAAKDGSAVRVGSNSDTSTLANALALKTDIDGVAKSAYSISALNLSAPLTSVESGFYTYDENGEKVPLITEGEFVIGDATIKINSSTSMNELINKINSTPEANASAFFDTVENKLVINSAQEGAFNINIEAGTSNFTDIMGMTKNGAIIPDSQILGKNAELTINGTQIMSYSNSITSETSGIPGLTLDLKSVSSSDSPIEITIGQDTDKIVDEIETLFKALNDAISKTDTATGEDGGLRYESRLSSIRNELRSEAVTAVQGLEDYKTLASIGITTGAVGTSVDADTNSFIIDEEKLREALQRNPEGVKKLLLGDSDSGTTGVISTLQDTVNVALDSESGYFATRSESLSSQMQNISDKIDAQYLRIQTYQESLESKFQAMDQQIAELQQQYSQMSSALGTSS